MLFLSHLVGLAAVANLASACKLPHRQELPKATQVPQAQAAQVNTKASGSTRPRTRVNHRTDLKPILNPDCDTKNPKNFVPSKKVALEYGMKGNPMVKVDLDMNRPTVMLEEIEEIKNVDCEAHFVTITFANKVAYKEAVGDWSDDEEFVLVTNHLGDCDAENERGFYIVNKLDLKADTLTIVASGDRSDVQHTAEYTEITFSSVPTLAKRAITIKDGALTFAHSLALPEGTSLYSQAPYLDIVADMAQLSTTVTLSGKLKFSIWKAKLEQFSFDVDAEAAAELGLTVDVNAPFSKDAVFDPAPLTYSFVNVPGIITMGPALDFAIGVNLEAQAKVSLTTDLSVKIQDANFHLDFLDSAKTTSTNWQPVFSAKANLTEQAAVSIDPYVDLTVMLECKIFGGLVDLSGGVTAQPRFNNDFVLTAKQELEGNATETGAGGAVTQPVEGSCSQGLSIKSEFQFSLIAFVTQWWRETVYSVVVPVADECYTWL